MRLSKISSRTPVSCMKLSLLHRISCVSGRKTIIANGAESIEALSAVVMSSVTSSMYWRMPSRRFCAVWRKYHQRNAIAAASQIASGMLTRTVTAAKRKPTRK